MKVTHLTSSGSKEQVTVSAKLFGAEVNSVLLSQAVRVYLANLRQGTAKVKTRSEINRSKKKWFKQKGTGNARHGARTPNIFVGGGVSHGPTGIQNWSLKLTNRMKHQALVSALSAQAKNMYVADLTSLKGKTSQAVKLLAPVLSADQRVLVVTEDANVPLLKSLRNLPQVLVMTAARVTALEVAMADAVVASEAALTALETRIVREAKAETAAKPAVKTATPAVKAEKTVKAPAKKATSTLKGTSKKVAK